MKRVKRYQDGGMTTVNDSLSALGVSGSSVSSPTGRSASSGIDKISEGMDAVNQSMNTVSDAIYGGSSGNLNVGTPNQASGTMYKKGGKVKVSSASKRGDGCAQRGKTKGRMV